MSANRTIFLVVVMLLFLGATAYLLFFNFSPSSADNYKQGRGYSQTQVQVSGSAIKILEQQVGKTSDELGPNGSWSQLENDTRYQRLSDEALLPVIVGNHGTRPNPFLPLEFEDDER